jgi:hypothetical protein
MLDYVEISSLVENPPFLTPPWPAARARSKVYSLLPSGGRPKRKFWGELEQLGRNFDPSTVKVLEVYSYKPATRAEPISSENPNLNNIFPPAERNLSRPFVINHQEISTPMKKLVCILIMALGLVALAQAQKPATAPPSPFVYLEGYQRLNHNLAKVDSAFYFLQKLASHPSYRSLLGEILHNMLAFEMANPHLVHQGDSVAKRNLGVFHQTMLAKIEADTSRLLTKLAQPIIGWNKVMNAQPDLAKFGQQAQAFLAQSLTDEQF